MLGQHARKSDLDCDAGEARGSCGSACRRSGQAHHVRALVDVEQLHELHEQVSRARGIQMLTTSLRARSQVQSAGTIHPLDHVLLRDFRLVMAG
jgi:hypothetical protein